MVNLLIMFFYRYNISFTISYILIAKHFKKMNLRYKADVSASQRLSDSYPSKKCPFVTRRFTVYAT